MKFPLPVHSLHPQIQSFSLKSVATHFTERGTPIIQNNWYNYFVYPDLQRFGKQSGRKGSELNKTDRHFQSCQHKMSSFSFLNSYSWNDNGAH